MMETRVSDFSPAAYPDMPLYNIQAVAAATGVPAITLRSWERRYGVPEPKRDTKGYRLYSERDIAVTRWLKERVQQGVGISRAVNMLRVLETGELASEPSATFDFGALRGRLVDAIDRLDETGVNRVMAEALMVASVEDVCLGLVQPALYDIGELWQSGRLSVTAEHVGSHLLRSHLGQLLRISPPPFRDGKVFVGCAPGEAHDIGSLMVALFLRRRGVDAVFLGANVEPESLLRDVRRLQPSSVCLSASTTAAVEGLSQVFRELDEEYSGVLAFGGRVFQEQCELVESVPGTYAGSDAAAALTSLESALLQLQRYTQVE